MARAAKEAGVSLWEMMEYLRQKRIPARYDLEDLEHDLEMVYKRSEEEQAKVPKNSS